MIYRHKTFRWKQHWILTCWVWFISLYFQAVCDHCVCLCVCRLQHSCKWPGLYCRRLVECWLLWLRNSQAVADQHHQPIWHQLPLHTGNINHVVFYSMYQALTEWLRSAFAISSLWPFLLQQCVCVTVASFDTRCIITLLWPIPGATDHQKKCTTTAQVVFVSAVGGCDPVQRHSTSGNPSGWTPGRSTAHPGHTGHHLPGGKHTGRTAFSLQLHTGVQNTEFITPLCVLIIYDHQNMNYFFMQIQVHPTIRECSITKASFFFLHILQLFQWQCAIKRSSFTNRFALPHLNIPPAWHLQ